MADKGKKKEKKSTKKEKTLVEPPKLEISGSRLLPSWMVENRVSLMFTTYQTGKLFLVGLKPDGHLSIFERTFNRCMGLGGDSECFYMSSLYQLWRFQNVLPKDQVYKKQYDKIYVPQMGNTTGDIDVHDIGIDKEGKPIFVNTLFSCLATPSETASFKVVWKPNFITKLAAEDRCHLNGLAMVDGKPKYVCAVADTDVHEGWREHRKDGGIVMDVDMNEVICGGLSMPHSVRYYQGKIWILNSGTGEFGYIDEKKGKFEPVCFCPGYARGLAFINDYAIIGLSLFRHNKTFSDLPLDARLKKAKVSPRCGLRVIDLKTGDCVHSLNIEGIVEELYDVMPLPQVQCPMALGFKTDEIRHMLCFE